MELRDLETRCTELSHEFAGRPLDVLYNDLRLCYTPTSPATGRGGALLLSRRDQLPVGALIASEPLSSAWTRGQARARIREIVRRLQILDT